MLAQFKLVWDFFGWLLNNCVAGWIVIVFSSIFILTIIIGVLKGL